MKLIYTILISIVVLIALYYILGWMFSSSTKLSSLHDAKKPQLISGSKLPSSNSNNYAYSTWFYIDDWNYNYGKEKILLLRKSKDSNSTSDDCLRISLGTYENNISIKLPTYVTSDSCGGKQCDKKEDCVDGECMVRCSNSSDCGNELELSCPSIGGSDRYCQPIWCTDMADGIYKHDGRNGVDYITGLASYQPSTYTGWPKYDDKRPGSTKDNPLTSDAWTNPPDGKRSDDTGPATATNWNKHCKNYNAVQGKIHNTKHGKIHTHETNINNFPLQKWVNLIISVYGRTLDIYIDGKLVKSDILEGVAKPCKDSSVHITPSDKSHHGGFAGWTSNFKYWTHALNPQEAYNVYRDGYGGSGLGNLFNKYRLKIAFLEDNHEEASFEI